MRICQHFEQAHLLHLPGTHLKSNPDLGTSVSRSQMHHWQKDLEWLRAQQTQMVLTGMMYFWNTDALIRHSRLLPWLLIVKGGIMVHTGSSPCETNNSMQQLECLAWRYSHQQKSWADELPAEPPVEAWLEAHHPLNVLAEAVHSLEQAHIFTAKCERVNELEGLSWSAGDQSSVSALYGLTEMDEKKVQFVFLILPFWSWHNQHVLNLLLGFRGVRSVWYIILFPCNLRFPSLRVWRLY